jgi:hypothetical protein
MKKQIAVAVAMLVAAIAAGQCYAQHTSLKADIPFAFQVGNKPMPAGEYWIQRANDQDRGLALTLAVDAKDGKSDPVLVFHKYGNSYFLSEIWTGESQGRQLFKSEREKDAD